MFTSQITRALDSDPYVGPYFAGVFPSDKLPETISYPCALVANTDSSSEKGEHWVCYYFDGDKNAEYFDSYGMPPANSNLFNFFLTNGSTFNYNLEQLQGLESDVCGQYCIAFLAKRARGQSLPEIIECYKGKKPGANDTAMARVVNKTYKINMNQGGGGFSCEQCCCSRMKCMHKTLQRCIVSCHS